MSLYYCKHAHAKTCPALCIAEQMIPLHLSANSGMHLLPLFRKTTWFWKDVSSHVTLMHIYQQVMIKCYKCSIAVVTPCFTKRLWDTITFSHSGERGRDNPRMLIAHSFHAPSKRLHSGKNGALSREAHAKHASYSTTSGRLCRRARCRHRRYLLPRNPLSTVCYRHASRS